MLRGLGADIAKDAVELTDIVREDVGDSTPDGFRTRQKPFTG